MPKDKVLADLDKQRKKPDFRKDLNAYKSWAIERFGERLGTKMYNTAKGKLPEAKESKVDDSSGARIRSRKEEEEKVGIKRGIEGFDAVSAKEYLEQIKAKKEAEKKKKKEKK